MVRAIFISLITVIFTSVFAVVGMTQGQTGAASGEQVFKEQCSACHAGGGNILNPKIPLKGSPRLQTFAALLSWIRKPVQPTSSLSPLEGLRCAGTEAL